MSKSVRNAVIAIAIVVVLSIAQGLIGIHGILVIVLPLIIGGAAYFLLQMLSGNKKENQATAAERQLALAAAPVPGHALVYIYREGFMGKALGYDVIVDGQPVAQLKSPRFVCINLPAGPHGIEAGPKGFATLQNKAAQTRFNANPGETIIFRLDMSLGLIQNQVVIRREVMLAAALEKMSKITMLMPSQPTATQPVTTL